MAQCYVYKWTHKPTFMWYIGSRTAKNSHPNDGYICSSRYIKPLIESNPLEWTRDIIAVGSASEMRELETEILVLLEAHKDPRSFNLTNTAGKIMSKVAWNKGKKGVQIAWNKGITGEKHHNFGKKYKMKKSQKHSEEFREALRQRMLTNNSMKLKFSCPHCEYVGPKSRWHWDKCRSKV